MESLLQLDTSRPSGCDNTGQCKLSLLRFLGGQSLLAYDTYAVPQQIHYSTALLATRTPSWINDIYYPKRWYFNGLITHIIPAMNWKSMLIFFFNKNIH